MTISDPRSLRPSRAISASTTGISKLCSRVADICRYEIVEANAIRAHVTFRAKGPKSLESKLRKFAQTGKKSLPTVDSVFDQVRDLAAVRVATYVQTDERQSHRGPLPKRFVWGATAAQLIDLKGQSTQPIHRTSTELRISRSTCRSRTSSARTRTSMESPARFRSAA